MITICATCHRLYDHQCERWTDIILHSDRQDISHGICFRCIRREHPELADEVIAKIEKDQAVKRQRNKKVWC